ncbi:thioredoxin fold domain-containing protein [Sulfurimonas sp. HSL-1716]|uniref:thioredoxin family protein n=1 Tax=Hydrocurvibacter sulfurireducens TaxID=3131937 RepID=UPI0031F9DB58
MKLILTLLFLGFSLFASELDDFAKKTGFERDYATALKKSKHLDLPVMLVLTKQDCPWCRRLEKNTLASDTIQSRLKNEVVAVIVDKDLEKKHFPSQKYQAHISPKVLFIDPKRNKILLEIDGFLPKEDFAMMMDKVKERWKK